MCQKNSCSSPTAAWLALMGVRRRRGSTGRVENGVHFCAACRAFHLTSHAGGKWRLESSTGSVRATYPENGSSI